MAGGDSVRESAPGTISNSRCKRGRGLGASPPQVPGDPSRVTGPRPRRLSGWTPRSHPGPHATPKQNACLEKGRLNRLRVSSRNTSNIQDTIKNSAHHTKNWGNHGVHEKQQSTNAETDRTLESSDEDYKAAITEMPQQQSRTCLTHTEKQEKSRQRKRRYKITPKGNFRTERNTIKFKIRLKKKNPTPLDGLDSILELAREGSGGL